jgi:hypothetical protein
MHLSLKHWAEHRAATLQALTGNPNTFATKYGYMPKAVYRTRGRRRKPTDSETVSPG